MTPFYTVSFEDYGCPEKSFKNFRRAKKFAKRLIETEFNGLQKRYNYIIIWRMKNRLESTYPKHHWLID